MQNNLSLLNTPYIYFSTENHCLSVTSKAVYADMYFYCITMQAKRASTQASTQSKQTNSSHGSLVVESIADSALSSQKASKNTLTLGWKWKGSVTLGCSPGIEEQM